jgi:predicted dehydrogenase
MKQLLQNMRDGKAEVVEVPIPTIKQGYLLVKNQSSVVSAGTERMVVEFAEKNLVDKARSRPDLVRQVIDKAKREGIIPTIQSAFNKLDQPMALGYSSAGIVIAVGEGVTGFQPGTRVACAGGGFASHAEYILVPKNLVVPIPDTLSFDEAAFTTIAAISLQGFRLANNQVGENVAIIGLGLLGLMMIGIAQSAGCNVFGVDLDADRVKLAEEFGADACLRATAIDQAQAFTKNRGFDSVFICADTSSNDPVELAGSIARDRGVVVAVGAVGMEIPRRSYYEKELSFLISRSYGPGRYDLGYEESGKDYPYGYVRWTEGRNLDAIVQLISAKKIPVEKLITHRFQIEEGEKAYQTITGKSGKPFIGVVIKYPVFLDSDLHGISHSVEVRKITEVQGPVSPVLGVLGAGNYAGAMFLPIIQKFQGVQLKAICSGRGLSASHAAKKFGFSIATTEEDDILQDSTINTVLVLTRHQDHARQVIKGLKNNQNIYCEKPLVITRDELSDVKTTYEVGSGKLMVGFNRRFAPMIKKMKEFMGNSAEPLRMHYRINAGYLPLSHWVHDLEQGGGRILGEGCHFIDTLMFLCGEKPIAVRAFGLPENGKYKEDNVVMVFTFSGGSIGTIEYLANGDKSVPKEMIEVFSGGFVAQLEDFRKLKLVSNGKKKMYTNHFKQDKGHAHAWAAFVNCLKTGKESPISFPELEFVTLASFAAIQSLRESREISI